MTFRELNLRIFRREPVDRVEQVQMEQVEEERRRSVHRQQRDRPRRQLVDTKAPVERAFLGLTRGSALIVLGVIAKVGLEIGGAVIKMRADSAEVIEILGGKKIHPAWAVLSPADCRMVGSQLIVKKLANWFAARAIQTIGVTKARPRAIPSPAGSVVVQSVFPAMISPCRLRASGTYSMTR